MATGVWSETEPHVAIESPDDLSRFIDLAEQRCLFPAAISVETHEYDAQLLVGHELSFVYLSPLTEGRPYYVTTGGNAEGYFEFWLHTQHHTEFERRYLIDKALARSAFREFFLTGQLSAEITWEANP